MFGPVFSHQNASGGPEFEAYDPHVGQTTGQADTAYFDGEEPVSARDKADGEGGLAAEGEKK